MRFSVLPARAIDDDRLSRTHLRCLAALCTYTDKNGWAWPSTSTIAERLGVSRQLISRCLHDLAAWEYVEIRLRPRDGQDGGQTTNLYRVLFDIGEPVAPPATSEVAPPATSEIAPPATSGGCTNAAVYAPPVNAAAACQPILGAAAGSKRKHPDRTAHGIECWFANEDAEAASLEATHDPDQIVAAVLAIKARKNSRGNPMSPVPALVLRELEEAQRAAKAAEQRAAADAAYQARLIAAHDPIDPVELERMRQKFPGLQRRRPVPTTPH